MFKKPTSVNCLYDAIGYWKQFLKNSGWKNCENYDKPNIKFVINQYNLSLFIEGTTEKVSE